ncbi:GNAT family N-acetyltransferase [Micromonospora sp. M12]
MSTLVEDNPAKHRFEILVDDAFAGFTAYLPRGRSWSSRTPRWTGASRAGVGGALVRGTLDQVRARGATVVPQCPFMAAFIDKHPEYADLVADLP